MTGVVRLIIEKIVLYGIYCKEIKKEDLGKKMEFLELAKQRFSCRMYSDKKVEKEKIDRILEAARLAPTARNYQPQRILVLTEEEELKKLSNCTPYGWNAPVIMIVFYDKEKSYKRDSYDNKEFGDIDASIITTHMMFEAEELGLGTTWIGAFDPKKVMEIYNVPQNFVPVAILPIGYPSDDAHPSKWHTERNEKSEFVHWNKWN